MFCPNCGAEVGEGRKFCGKCGATVGAGAGAGGSSEETPLSAPVVVETAPRLPLSPLSKLVYACIALLVVLGGVAWWWFHRPESAYRAKDPGIYDFNGITADGKAYKDGFIDDEGNVVVQPQWDLAMWGQVEGQPVTCSEDLCGVKKDGKWGYINSSGHLVIATQFDSESPFVEGLAKVQLGKLYGFIDKTGQYVINPQFDQAGDFHEGLASVHKDGDWGFINKAGMDAIKSQFQAVDGFSTGLAAACLNGKCGYIDHNGSFAVLPQFDSVSAFSEGLSAVLISGKWGYINRAGKIVINPQFDQTTMFYDGLAVVAASGRQGTIDTQGKYVVNPGQYTIDLGSTELESAFDSDGRGILSRDGKWVVKPTKILNRVQGIYGKVFYGDVGGQSPIPISMKGKILSGWYKGATLDSLGPDLQNETSAYQSIALLTHAEAGYANAFQARGFTASLKNLGPANGSPDENHVGFIDAALAAGTKDGYTFTAIIPSGSATGGVNGNYFITAKPVAGHSGRTFCVDSTRVIRYAAQGEECTTASPIEFTVCSALMDAISVHPVQSYKECTDTSPKPLFMPGIDPVLVREGNNPELQPDDEAVPMNSGAQQFATSIDPPSNIRVAPSSSSAIICSIGANTPIHILGLQGDWYKTDVCSGKLGYIHRGQIKF